jgi:hypothetical protein
MYFTARIAVSLIQTHILIIKIMGWGIAPIQSKINFTSKFLACIGVGGGRG